jgi:hypothetical protein
MPCRTANRVRQTGAVELQAEYRQAEPVELQIEYMQTEPAELKQNTGRHAL